MPDIAAIRKEYRFRTLSEADVAADPYLQFGKWWEEATNSALDEVNAMTLATATAGGRPSARIVLLKEFTPQGFTFFTNYESHKGKELAENPFASLLFFWAPLERQVRIEGRVEKIRADDSDAYFNSRPEGSRIGAWSSPQSAVIPGREMLEENEASFRKKFIGQSIPRPGHWGGYIVKPVLIEFWQGRPNRLHDRIQYTLQDNGGWKTERLAP